MLWKNLPLWYQVCYIPKSEVNNLSHPENFGKNFPYLCLKLTGRIRLWVWWKLFWRFSWVLVNLAFILHYLFEFVIKISENELVSSKKAQRYFVDSNLEAKSESMWREMLILIIHSFISIRAENTHHGRFNIRWQPTEGHFFRKLEKITFHSEDSYLVKNFKNA